VMGEPARLRRWSAGDQQRGKHHTH
jgi:hypothetical protein